MNRKRVPLFITLYYHFIYGPGSSVGIVTKDWTVWGLNPGGVRFSARPYRPWDPHTLLYHGYRVFAEVKCGRSVLLTTHPLLVPWL
jgi:hypothetical protein